MERRAPDGQASLTSFVPPPLRCWQVPFIFVMDEFRERFPAVTSVERHVSPVLRARLRTQPGPAAASAAHQVIDEIAKTPDQCARLRLGLANTHRAEFPEIGDGAHHVQHDPGLAVVIVTEARIAHGLD